MKKILLSFGIITVLAVVVFAGSTGAFLSDTETSANNVFTAGAIDLKVDNESYYNGAVSPSTSWALDDLDNGRLFFNFRDLKPDDEGEDTISLHVNDNDAYLCMDMSITSDNDISSNEPELDALDLQDDLNNSWDGELGGLLQMFWWVDDGDNVYEQGESQLPGASGVQTIKDLFGADKTYSVDLADSTTNVWTPNTPGPIPGGVTKYIAKAWCFGTLTLAPLAQDNLGTDGPLAPGRVGTGVNCAGQSLDNKSQTDGVTLDIAFRAIQARHNANYTCGDETPRLAKLTVIKQIVNDNGGNNVVADYQLQVVGNVVTNVTSGVATNFAAGNYIVTETGIPGYVASFSGDCNNVGQVTLNPGDVKTCTITNNDLTGNITVVKNVINNNGGIKQPVQFPLLVDNSLVQNNTSVPVLSNTPHTIDETQQAGYSFVSMTGTSNYGQSCPAVLGGSITLAEGESITCTITNDDIAP